jgi:hypothetical protein
MFHEPQRLHADNGVVRADELKVRQQIFIGARVQKTNGASDRSGWISQRNMSTETKSIFRSRDCVRWAVLS